MGFGFSKAFVAAVGVGVFIGYQTNNPWNGVIFVCLFGISVAVWRLLTW